MCIKWIVFVAKFGIIWQVKLVANGFKHISLNCVLLQCNDVYHSIYLENKTVELVTISNFD